MGSLYRGSWFRRWSRGASVTLCGLALASLPAWSQNLPQAPVNSDAAFRILPSANTVDIPPDILREQPLIRLISETAVSYFGFDPLFDVGEAFEGTVVGAVLSDGKKGSLLGQYFKEQEVRAEREDVVRQMQELQADLETYKGSEGSYPEDYRKYIDEYRYFEPYLPPGVTYDYKLTEGGQGFRLVVSYAPDETRLDELGPPPLLGDSDFAENLQPTVPGTPLNFVLGAKVQDATTARELALRIFGEPKDGFWTSQDDPPLVATLRGSWLVLSDRKENLGPFLKSLNGQAPGLSKNPVYQQVARNIDMDSAGMAFVDLPRILKPMDLAETPDQKRLLELVGPMGYSVTPYDKFQFRLEVFLGMRAPKGSELEKILQASAGANPEAAMVAGNIPWDVSNAFAVDYRQAKHLFDALVALSPEAEETLDVAEDVWAGFLGLDAERGFDNIVDGWAIVSFERLDIFVNAFEGFTEAMNSIPAPPEMPEMEGQGGPPDETLIVETETTEVVEETTVEENAEPTVDPSPTVDEEVEIEVQVDPETEVDIELETDPDGDVEMEVTPERTGPPRIPFTVAFRVTDEQARQALLEALNKQLGEEPAHNEVYGVDVVGRQDGLLSYALRDDWFYISGGKTQRLLRNLLAAATGRKESLTSLQSWSRFKADQRGQVIALGHQKVDAGYSILKGFLLFLGPDFRPLAYELGKLRDYHSAAFIVPDGMLLVGDVLQGDGR